MNSTSEKREDAFFTLGISAAEVSLIKTILYFDIFNYPLIDSEVFRAQADPKLSLVQVQKMLLNLSRLGWLERYENFYGFGDLAAKVKRRKKGNQLAKSQMELARKRSVFISRFPFVRAVMLSGSLSKDYMETGSDIDFFVITKPGRLWLARTMLIFYKKIFLLNSHKSFCMNYFIDEENLEIEDKNIFTATEVAFLVPTVNHGLYTRFRHANLWTDEYYPHFKQRGTNEYVQERGKKAKQFVEWLLSGFLGTRLDTFFLKLTLKRWMKKFSHLTPEHFEVALRSRKHVSKHHPSNYQAYVLNKLEKAWEELQEQMLTIQSETQEIAE